MTNSHSKNHQQSQFLKEGGHWVTGKADRYTPVVVKGIEEARQMQQQIKQQKDTNPESLKRIVKL
jgi:hypothetical protein